MSSLGKVVRLNARTFPVSAIERDLLAGATLVETEGQTPEEILAAARDADVVMVVSAALPGAVIRALTHCRLISRLGTGVDKIDVAEATRQGIVVANLPDFCTEEVADHTLALLLALARRLPSSDRMMRRGARTLDLAEWHRLAVQTAGLVGLGRIGQAVARRCRAFGMQVLACDPRLTPAVAAREGVEQVELPDLLARADYVCLLCPLLPATRGLIAAPQFALMKRSAFLVNTARGELVNEPDLVAALRNGVIRGAALDVFAGINVFAPGGFPTDYPLLGLENVLLTPHLAAASAESLLSAHRRGAQAVADVLRGHWPRDVVNPEVQPRVPMDRGPA